MKTEYVAGFMFSPDKKRVLLVEKNRPEFQKGKLNGIGGKIEPGEFPSNAMVREFREETGVETNDTEWDFLCSLSGGGSDGWKVYFFYCFSYKHEHAHTTTDERIYSIRVASLWHRNIMPNLRVFIPLALDDSGLAKQVKFYDES